MGWVSHLQDSGFTVRTTDVPDVRPIKIENEVPPRLGSCHTALVDGYVIEGHVPAEDIERLRLRATSSLMEREDVIVVASVSCIYGLGNPMDYRSLMLHVRVGQKIGRREILKALVGI